MVNAHLLIIIYMVIGGKEGRAVLVVRSTGKSGLYDSRVAWTVGKTGIVKYRLCKYTPLNHKREGMI